MVNLATVAEDLRTRLIRLFALDEEGNRRVNGQNKLFNSDKHFKDLVLFYEYFHGDNGKGIGASHQTGWTGIIATNAYILL